MIAENTLDRHGLVEVVEMGRGAVGVDVVHLLGVHPAAGKRHLDAARRTLAAGGGSGQVVGVAGKAVAATSP